MKDPIQLKNRTIDEYGTVTLKPEAGCELLYQGNDILDFKFEQDPEIELYNKYIQLLSGIDQDDTPLSIYEPITQDLTSYDREKQSEWFTPEPYNDLDVEEILLSLCNTQEEIDRVKEEMILFRERGLEKVLQTLIWLVAEMRENSIVWGVGRGSSCASYCLYLIGIHRVDSIRYGLDIREFLK